MTTIVTNPTDTPAPNTVTLREAIAATAAGSTITFAPNISTVTLTSDELLINKSLTIIGNPTTVTRDRTAPNFRIFNIQGTDSLLIQVSMENLTISYGVMADNDIRFGNGGGINTVNANVILNNAIITNNSAYAAGGGIYARGGTITITNSTITNSNIDRNINIEFGGGIFLSQLTSATITNTTISNNISFSNQFGIAGGITLNRTDLVTILNTTIANNTSRYPILEFPGNGGGMSLILDNNTTLTYGNRYVHFNIFSHSEIY